MPEATFVLKEPSGTEPTLVYLFYRFNGSKLKYSTGWKIKPKFWNEVSQRARETRQFSKFGEFNTLLSNLSTEVEDAHRTLINNRVYPTPELLKKALDKFQSKGKKETNDLIAFAEAWIENVDRKKNTKKQLGQALRNLKEFKQASKRSLLFETIDLEFYDQFIDFLLKKNYSRNSIGTIIKNVKVFMNEAVERKLTTNLQFKNKRFKTIEEPSESIYLTEKEIKAILALDLSENSRLEKVRDLFVIGCYTGLRFADLSQLRKENINGQVVKVKTQKTGETVVIPLKSSVKEILKKYKGVPPSVISNQKMNDYLKELGEKAKIKDDVIITVTKGGVRQTAIFKKWELITTHTARRSFASNAYLQNVPTISIMKITGHRTEKSFLKYIKISQEDNANKLITHPFFK